MCIWEGAADWYRDMTHHGGILSHLLGELVRHAGQDRAIRAGRARTAQPGTGQLVCGDETLADEELAAQPLRVSATTFSRIRWTTNITGALGRLEQVTVPFLSAANWGGQGLHPRGNFEGFMRAASKDKYLEAHGLEHWTHFYTDYGVASCRSASSTIYLKGEQNGWDRNSRASAAGAPCRSASNERAETEWPLARTQWTRFYLDPADAALVDEPLQAPKATVTFTRLGDGVTFLSAPFTRETEITGPLAREAARLVVDERRRPVPRVPRLHARHAEVIFVGAIDPHTPIAQGWLRASHRKLDAEAQPALASVPHA